MPDFFQTPKFQLPNDWSPVGERCIVLTIPDDDQYQSMVIGFLDALKWSRNYAHDATGAGAATVSRTFERAMLARPILQKGCTDMVMRQDPDHVCILQQSSDGGETWVEAFNFALCLPTHAVIFHQSEENPCLLEESTDGGLTYTPIFDFDACYTPDVAIVTFDETGQAFTIGHGDLGIFDGHPAPCGVSLAQDDMGDWSNTITVDIETDWYQIDAVWVQIKHEGLTVNTELRVDTRIWDGVAGGSIYNYFQDSDAVFDWQPRRVMNTSTVAVGYEQEINNHVITVKYGLFATDFATAIATQFKIDNIRILGRQRQSSGG